MKVSNEQFVCCLICFLLGYHFRSLFGMEGFALNDYHHSAYVKFPSRYIDAADVTEKFMKSNPDMYAT